MKAIRLSATFLLMLLLLLLSALDISAKTTLTTQTQSSLQIPTPTTGSSLLPTPLVDQRLATLESEMPELKKKLEKPPKDVWDKLTAVSGLVSGLLVAIIGGVATYLYNERRRTSEEAHNKRELSILQAQTIQSFMPQLQSADPRAVDAALVSIGAIDPMLATNLAMLFQSPGAVSALSKMAASSNPEASKQASESISNLFSPLQSSVITILDSKKRPFGSGFFASRNGYIVTTDYIAEEIETKDIKVAWKDIFYAVDVVSIRKSEGLAILKVEGEQFPVLGLDDETQVYYLDTLFSLVLDDVLGRRLASGQVIGIDSRPEFMPTTSFILLGVRSPTGSGGSPVVNLKGKVVGMVYGGKREEDITVVLPSRTILRVLNELLQAKVIRLN